MVPETIEPDCMLCGGQEFEVLRDDLQDVVFHKPGRFGLHRCQACDLVMTRPRPVDLGFYYQDTYSGSDGLGALKRRLDAREDTVVRQRLQILDEHHAMNAGTRLLDIGCGNGALLWHARRRWGCQTTGIDFDATAFEGAFEPEATTYLAGTLATLELPAASFDVVVFPQSLEHVPEPVATLERARRLLAPGGIVVVEVPNFAGALRPWFGRYWMPYLIPQHTVHFTPSTLTAAFDRAGLQVDRIHHLDLPFEGTMSAFLAYGHLTGLPPFGEPPRLRIVIDLLIALVLAGFLLVERPILWWLARTGRSGHITAVGRPRDPPQSASPSAASNGTSSEAS